ncbi:peptidoglycan recognition protein [Streptomyces siamensis]|uniref:Peptidoglycan recognition protein n=1 Tax=Streptomyces siamensis TaxID=1274986 RepID=A0ABP9IKX5_9ACTN
MRVFRKTRGARARGAGRPRPAVLRRLRAGGLGAPWTRWSRGGPRRPRRGRFLPWSARAPHAPGFPDRLPRTVRVLLGCVPGLAAVLALVMCAATVDRTQTEPARPSAARPAAAHPGPRPPIVPRSKWLDAASTHAQPAPRYDDRVVAVFVHHTDSPNGYDCADAPRIIRDLYAGQTGAKDWDDIGYNFLVDRCGTIYEGRAGGIDRPVTGAHTQGFNHRTAGVAAIGTFTSGTPVPRAMTDAIARLVAWKLGISDTDPRATVRLRSSNSLSRFAAGTSAALPTVAGHNAAFMTTCPGAALTGRLPAIRDEAARLQGR